MLMRLELVIVCTGNKYKHSLPGKRWQDNVDTALKKKGGAEGGFQLRYQNSSDTSGLTGSYEQFPSETRLLI